MWLEEVAQMSALARRDDVKHFVCVCGKNDCDGARYREPYSRNFSPCPLRASAQSSEKTAVTSDASAVAAVTD